MVEVVASGGEELASVSVSSAWVDDSAGGVVMTVWVTVGRSSLDSPEQLASSRTDSAADPMVRASVGNLCILISPRSVIVDIITPNYYVGNGFDGRHGRHLYFGSTMYL